jgi:hypothetical protein
MQVASFTLDLGMNHASSRSTSTRTVRQADVTPRSSAQSEPASRPAIDLTQTVAPSTPLGSSDDDLPPLLSLAKRILEQMFGIRFTLIDGKLLTDGQAAARDASSPTPASQAPARPAAAETGTQEVTTHYEESEQTRFTANGSVTTASGQTLQFSLDVSMQRAYSSTSTRVSRYGPGTDPLMITLGADAGKLSGATVSFDMKGDGGKVDLPFAQSGGWLALDKNGNGKIDNGTELFGPQSGNGFSDLARLDSNHDGVIDQSDPAFADLRVWSGVDSKGNDQLASLQDLHIGAIFLPNVDTPFTIKDTDNNALAQMRRSGVFLQDDGQAGMISQVDVMA